MLWKLTQKNKGKERNLLHDPINVKKIAHLTQTQFNLPLLKYVFEFRVGCAEHQR